jgi:hypothetical protein
MTKAHSTIHDNGGRCESCDRPESVREAQTAVEVYFGNELGWGTMWPAPSRTRPRSRAGAGLKPGLDRAAGEVLKAGSLHVSSS